MNKLSDPELDDLLRRAFAGPVADDGFSAQVVRTIAPSGRVGIWLPAMAALAGSLLAWFSLLPSALWRHAMSEWLMGSMGASSATMCAVLFSMGLLGCIWALDEAV